MPNPFPPGRRSSTSPNSDLVGLGTSLLTGGKEWLREKTAPIADAVKRGLEPGDYLSGRLRNAVQAPEKYGRERIDTGDTTVVVVGGGADGYTTSDFSGARAYADSFSNKKFFTHLETKLRREAVLRSIEERAKGGPIILVGHSWGGPQAYELARDLTDRGNSVIGLFTADPVSSKPSGARPRTFWVNVAAASRSPNLSDHIAKFGGKPSQLPVRTADIDATGAGHHEELASIMQQRLNGGVSAEDQIQALVKTASRVAPRR